MSSNSSQGSQQLPELRTEKIDVVVRHTFIDMPVSSNHGPVRRASLPASLDRILPSRELEKLVASRRSSISDVSTDLHVEEQHIDECEHTRCDRQVIAPPETYSKVVVAQWPTCPYPPQPQILSTTFHPSQMEVPSAVDIVENGASPRRHQQGPANYEDLWQSVRNMVPLDTSASPRRGAPTTGSYHMHLQSVGNAVLDHSSSPRRRAPVGCAGYDSQWQHSTIESSMSPRRRPNGVGAQMRWLGPGPMCNSPEKSVSPQRRTALSSKAQAWQPAPPAQNSRFNNQAADVMAKLEVALLSGEFDIDVVIKKDANNFTVLVSMQEEEVATNWALVMAEAQEVLLRAAMESSCVYLLGYESEPFQRLGNGFMATLGEMGDEAVACWDVYALGACHQGTACTKGHPQSSAYVVLELVD